MKAKVTQEAVEKLEIRKKIYDVTDESFHGFTVRVHPTGNKVFLIRYQLANGARGRYTLGKFGVVTVAQAKHQAKKILAMAAMGEDPKAKPPSNSFTLKQFIENEYSTWSEAHHQWSKDHIQKLYRFKEFINLPLNEINAQIVEKWRSTCLKNNLAPATVNRNTASLRSVISKAVEWGILETHPLSKFKQLRVDRSPNVRYLTEEEEKRLREALDTRELRLRKNRENGNQWRAEREYDLYPDLNVVPYVDYLKPLVLLSINTGARRGELFRMQWEDVDFDRKSIALVMRGKRKSYTRHIPLNNEAYETLLGWRKMRPLTDKMIFPSKNGTKFDNIQTSWENIRKEAKVNNFRWHDMRHHFASRLVMNGVPLNTVRELLGHTNVEMTLRYAHLAPEQKERAVATLDRI
jgi:integrase